MREGGRKLAAFVSRSRATIVLLVAIWAIGLGALAAVIVLETRVDNERHAQAVVALMQRQVGDLAGVAFNPAVTAPGAVPTVVQTDSQMAAERETIRASLRTLSALGGSGEAARIATLTGRYFSSIDRIATLVARGNSREAALEFGRAGQASGSYGALLNELSRASTSYGSSATRSRVIGSIGAVVAIIFMLLAFSFALSRATRLGREKQELLEASRIEALTDPLTGLANRRRLFADMEALLSERPPPDGLTLGMFDLDGFKEYNDTFGHPAGDALLARCGRKLAAAIEGHGSAYRMGGDEFCVIVRESDATPVLVAAQEALSEHSERFEVSCSRGSVAITPNEMTLEQALQQADHRLYSDKRSSRTRQGGAVHDVLLRLLAENSPTLATHLGNVGRLAEAVARTLRLDDDQIALTKLTAELHDIGKTALPDAILDKPGPLDDGEWDFIRRHTIIGERILAAAPALAQVAPLVRSTHERMDGSGYPDGLRGEEIPLVSRIVAAADAYDAMTNRRPYSLPFSPARAVAELRRVAGTQFDPDVAEALVSVVESGALASSARLAEASGAAA